MKRIRYVMRDISIIIPTFNNSELIRKQLLWYKRNNFSGTLIIADSSVGKSFEMVKAYTKDSGLKVCHLNCQEMEEKDATKHALDQVTTDFTCWSGDDDFHTTKGLYESSIILRKNIEVNAVRGPGLMIYLDNLPANPHRFLYRNYEPPMAVGKTISERVDSFVENGGGDTHYCLQRTDAMRKAYQYVHLIQDRTIGAAAMPVAMTILAGNVIRHSHFSLFKGVHKNRYNADHYTARLLTGNLFSDLQAFNECLLNECSFEIHSSDIKRKEMIVKLIHFLSGIEKNYTRHSCVIELFLNIKLALSSLRYAKSTIEFQKFFLRSGPN